MKKEEETLKRKLTELEENPLDAELKDDDILENAEDDISQHSSWDDSYEEDVENEVQKYLDKRLSVSELRTFHTALNIRETLYVEKLEKEKRERNLTNQLGEVFKNSMMSFNDLVLEKDLKEGEVDDALAYWKTKDREFKNFFLFGLKDRKTESQFVMNLNLYFYTRLLLYDICFLTLYNIPSLQVLLPLATEIFFLYAVFRVRFKHNLFTSNFIFLKLAFQSYAIVFWLFLSFCFTLTTQRVINTSIGPVAVRIPVSLFGKEVNRIVQYYALLLVFFAVLAEVLYVAFRIYCFLRDTFKQVRSRIKKLRELAREKKKNKKLNGGGGEGKGEN